MKLDGPVDNIQPADRAGSLGCRAISDPKQDYQDYEGPSPMQVDSSTHRLILKQDDPCMVNDIEFTVPLPFDLAPRVILFVLCGRAEACLLLRSLPQNSGSDSIDPSRFAP